MGQSHNEVKQLEKQVVTDYELLGESWSALHMKLWPTTLGASKGISMHAKKHMCVKTEQMKKSQVASNDEFEVSSDVPLDGSVSSDSARSTSSPASSNPGSLPSAKSSHKEQFVDFFVDMMYFFTNVM